MMEVVRSVFDSIYACCLNCREDDIIDREPTERTSLLHSSDQRISQIRRISENPDEYPSSLPKDKDDQSALSRIVQETNSNIIDVAALDTTHILEQSEYNDRVKLYNMRLAQQWNSIPAIDNSYNGLLRDLPNPEASLAFNPQIEELQAAREFIKDAAEAIAEMKIESHEDLVVPFQVT